MSTTGSQPETPSAGSQSGTPSAGSQRPEPEIVFPSQGESDLRDVTPMDTSGGTSAVNGDGVQKETIDYEAHLKKLK
ncbi:hypothetical protein ABG067_009501, partial [Albugo candida]